MDLPEPLITISPDYLSGAPIFTGTRVPVQALFDYIEGGDPLDEFLEDFPNVTREHAVAVLEMARRAAITRGGQSRGRVAWGRVRVRVLLDNCVPWRLGRDLRARGFERH